MGHAQSRALQLQSVQVALQLHYGDGSIYETVELQYYDVAGLLARIWNACVQAARAADLLLPTEPGARRVVLRDVRAQDCVSRANNEINLLERPELWNYIFSSPVTPSRIAVIADLVDLNPPNQADPAQPEK